MASEVAKIEPAQKAAVVAGARTAAFVPQTIEEAWRIAQALARSGMTPKAYGNDENKIMVGIMAGAEVGLTPFAALQSIAVIGNNPSIWGDGALAVVQASGLLEDIEETDDGTVATCRLRRTGRSTDIIRLFSIEDAKKAGLAGKAGPWTQYPARMRQMRARAFALRDGFADVLKGLHIAEEARDYTPMQTIPQAPALTGEMLVDQSIERQSTADYLDDEIPTYDRSTGEVEAEVEPEATGETEKHPGADDEPDPSEARLADIKERIAAAKTKQDAIKVDADWVKARAAYPDDVAGEVDALITAAMKALPPEQRGR